MRLLKEKVHSLKSEIYTLRSTLGLIKSSIKKESRFTKKSISDTFQLILEKLKDERRKSQFYEKDIQRLKKDLSYLDRINNDYCATSFKLNVEPFKSIINTQQSIEKTKKNENKSGYKYTESKKYGKKIGKVIESGKGSAVFLSPIKPSLDLGNETNKDVTEEESVDIKKLEISEIEKESMEIERRISRLKEKNRSYNRRAPGSGAYGGAVDDEL